MRLPALDEPAVVGMPAEQNVAGPGTEPPLADEDLLAVGVVPVPCAVLLLPAVPLAPALVCVPPAADLPDAGAEDVAAPPVALDEPIVCVGTSSGSVPQDDEVVTPPVALSETEHGIPGRLRAGLATRGLAEALPPEADVPGVAAGEDKAPGAALPDVAVCACA